MAKRDKNEILYDFLMKVDMRPGGCALYQDSAGTYYLAVKVTVSNGQPFFTINDKFFYDYSHRFSEEKPWKLLYVKAE